MVKQVEPKKYSIIVVHCCQPSGFQGYPSGIPRVLPLNAEEHERCQGQDETCHDEVSWLHVFGSSVWGHTTCKLSCIQTWILGNHIYIVYIYIYICIYIYDICSSPTRYHFPQPHPIHLRSGRRHWLRSKSKQSLWPACWGSAAVLARGFTRSFLDSTPWFYVTCSFIHGFSEGIGENSEEEECRVF